MFQSDAAERLHGDERLSLLLADVVNRADVWVVQRGGSLRFTLESAEGPADLWPLRPEEI